MLKKLAATGVVVTAATGAMMFSAPAYADVNTSGDGGVLSGGQIVAPITIPINVCGNAVAVIGTAFAGCKGGASVGGGHHHHH
jgi:hypothetical protein